MKYRALRWVCEFPTVVWHEQGTYDAEIQSVSETGAQLSCKSDLEPGEKIEVKCLLERISASVVWVNEDSCGIKFSRPIGEKQLSVIRKPGGTGSASGYTSKRLGHGFREL